MITANTIKLCRSEENKSVSEREVSIPTDVNTKPPFLLPGTLSTKDRPHSYICNFCCAQSYLIFPPPSSQISNIPPAVLLIKHSFSFLPYSPHTSDNLSCSISFSTSQGSSPTFKSALVCPIETLSISKFLAIETIND